MSRRDELTLARNLADRVCTSRAVRLYDDNLYDHAESVRRILDAALAAPPPAAPQPASVPDAAHGATFRGWPAECEWGAAPFAYYDSPGQHDPAYLVMPGHAGNVSFCHHDRNGVDQARAQFIAQVLNEWRSPAVPAQPDLTVEAHDALAECCRMFRWCDDRYGPLVAKLAAPPPDRNDLLGVGRAQSQHDAGGSRSSPATVPLFDPARLPPPDDEGWFSHPDLGPLFGDDEITQDEAATRLEKRGWESCYVDGADVATDEETGEYTGLPWEPERPQGEGWLLVSVFDTEDGPYALFVRPAPALVQASKDALRFIWREGYADKHPEVAALDRALKPLWTEHDNEPLVSGTGSEREARADERIGDERNGRTESVPPAAPQPATENRWREAYEKLRAYCYSQGWDVSMRHLLPAQTPAEPVSVYDDPTEGCPNCVSEWKCNGPHLPRAAVPAPATEGERRG